MHANFYYLHVSIYIYIIRVQVCCKYVCVCMCVSHRSDLAVADPITSTVYQASHIRLLLASI
jgi:hypothetical protein